MPEMWSDFVVISPMTRMDHRFVLDGLESKHRLTCSDRQCRHQSHTDILLGKGKYGRTVGVERERKSNPCRLDPLRIHGSGDDSDHLVLFLYAERNDFTASFGDCVRTARCPRFSWLLVHGMDNPETHQAPGVDYSVCPMDAHPLRLAPHFSLAPRF